MNENFYFYMIYVDGRNLLLKKYTEERNVYKGRTRIRLARETGKSVYILKPIKKIRNVRNKKLQI